MSYVFESKDGNSDILEVRMSRLCYETLPCPHFTIVKHRLGFVDTFVNFSALDIVKILKSMGYTVDDIKETHFGYL